jgi:hypothetical protein
MKQVSVIFFVLTFALQTAYSQSFSVDELITLAYMPSKNIGQFMKKKGFMLSWSSSDSSNMRATFIERIRSKNSMGPKRRIEINVKNGLKYFTLHTPALEEYTRGKQRLVKTGFFYDTLKDVQTDCSMLFQKANISINAITEVQDSISHYSFNLTEKSIPSTLMYAEDLLQFDSHQFLISYFGERNVKRDIYYLSETEFKKCSVLFSGTQRQAVFVWDNEVYLNDLAYVILTNKLPTEGAKNNNPLSGNNEWQLKNGIHPGMALKELLLINEMDFDIYGNKSDMAFLVKPNAYGKIDFKKTAIMLSCHQCFDNKIFNQKEVSALDVAKANLPMRVFDVVMYR